MHNYHPAVELPADLPRKAFRARGANVVRCESCRLPKEVCICAYRHQVPAGVEVWLIMHREEAFKPSNTGRLIADVLPSTQIFEWHRTQPPASLLARLQDPAYQPYLIFPADETKDQARLKPFERDNGKTPVFVILDGTWRQARRMFRHSVWLQQLPILEITPAASSDYELREAAEEDHLCTAEVGIELLNIAREPAAEVLRHYFRVFNVHYSAGRSGTPLAKAEESRRWLTEAMNTQVSDTESASV
ncbi:tRNA-uridine aminocarboxypropyltransferase [Pokkaliibacter sp. CJK22405]|uniref:tRNA-uridine aminocarboxypropyltransferase n=1 Tax=Pokkaliibacter sp. CJK22405 TaxID=3384615 RepID=UPI003984DB17